MGLFVFGGVGLLDGEEVYRRLACLQRRVGKFALDGAASRLLGNLAGDGDELIAAVADCVVELVLRDDFFLTIIAVARIDDAQQDAAPGVLRPFLFRLFVFRQTATDFL